MLNKADILSALRESGVVAVNRTERRREWEDSAMKGNKAGIASSKLRREPRRQRSRQSSERCASGVSTKHLDPAHNPAVLDTATWDRGAALGEPLGELTLKSGLRVAAYPTDAAVVDRYCRVLRPLNRPRALGATPRLGIGCRMTTLVWPGMFDALRRGNFAANTIQNSVRELNFLDDLLAVRPASTNYACGLNPKPVAGRRCIRMSQIAHKTVFVALMVVALTGQHEVQTQA